MAEMVDNVDEVADGVEKVEISEESGENATPSPEDLELCSKPSIDRSVKIDELVRLLNIFCQYPERYIFQKDENSKPMVLHNYVDKVVMAIRGCSSVIPARQKAAIDAGVVPGIVKIFTGPHKTDRETMVRTTQCFLGICGKNDEAIAAFKEAGAEAALIEVCKIHEGKDSSTNDMAKSLALMQD
jgi:hypothetical protein